ncbi:major facilitator superfamily domain-containing protein [Schizophyllum amplum]|uniref:Major facilitator superfamily domain-containing protein n=1 Tax=Schizophyllum amplum TaxID=97359 RepID=A0A550CJK2_9AGAR|nr:major facilitator superfamily domain-containing protein [Auriculariopsis ampla]
MAATKAEFIELECGSRDLCHLGKNFQTPVSTPGTSTINDPFPEILARNNSASTAAIIPKNESALPPADTGMQAWCFLLAAFLVDAMVWSFPFTYGVFLESYLSDETYVRQPHAEVLLPLIGTICTGIMYCSSPVLYPLMIRFPRCRRPAIWSGAILCAASLLAASFTTKVSSLVALQGVMYAIGGSLIYSPTMLYMSEWFIRLRGTASGVVFAGTATGGLVFPLVFPKIIASHGVPKTLRILAVVIACALLPVLPFIKGRLPHTRVQGPAPRASNHDWLKNPSFWLYIVVDLVQGFGHFMPIVWLPTFAKALNLSSLQSAATLAALNGATMIGGLSMGYLSDQLNSWVLTLCSLVFTALATFVLWGVLGNTFAGLIAYGLVYGFVAGSFSSLWASFARVYANEEPGLSTTIFGYMVLCRGIGNVLSTPIATALIGAQALSRAQNLATGFAVGGGKYQSMIIYSGSCFAGAAGLSLFGWRTESWALRRIRREVNSTL